jgi:hypothetical protein
MTTQIPEQPVIDVSRLLTHLDTEARGTIKRVQSVLRTQSMTDDADDYKRIADPERLTGLGYDAGPELARIFAASVAPQAHADERKRQLLRDARAELKRLDRDIERLHSQIESEQNLCDAVSGLVRDDELRLIVQLARYAARDLHYRQQRKAHLATRIEKIEASIVQAEQTAKVVRA